MIKEIVGFAEQDIVMTYFMDTSINHVILRKDLEPQIGANSIDDFYIIGTPSIIEIDEGMVVAHLAGLDDCLSYLNEKRIK